MACMAIVIFYPESAWSASPSNSGLTGLWEYPTAEVLGDGRGWFGYGGVDPYLHYYVALGYLPRLELNVRLTNFTNGPIISSEFGHYKDKGMDAKYLVCEQEGMLPNIAVGIMDASGTELLKAHYAVGTYRWDDWAVSLGWGSDRLNGIFGGISWDVAPWIELKCEYSPLDYNLDPFTHKPEKTSDWNYGAIVKTPWNFDLSVSYQRDKELCIGASYTFDLTKPIFGEKKKSLEDKIIKNLPSWDEADIPALTESIGDELSRRLAIRDVQVMADDTKEKRLLIAYENLGYSSEAEAMARVLYLTSHLIPWDADSVSLVAKVRGVPVSRVDVPGVHCAMLRLNSLRKEYRVEAAAHWEDDTKRGIETNFGKFWATTTDPKDPDRGTHRFGVRPFFETRLVRTEDNDYMDRWGIDAFYEWRSTNKGWGGIFDVRVPFSNNITIPWEQELNDKTRIWQGVVSKMTRLSLEEFELWEGGWVDDGWFGANFWRRKYRDGGRWWTGVWLSLVHERDPYDFASLSDKPIWPYRIGEGPSDYGDNEGWWIAGWLQAGYHYSPYDLDVKLEAGVFVDGDSGYQLNIMRHWDDIGIGLWMNRTDITYGRDYSFAGLYLEFPFDMWYGKQSDHIWTQSLVLSGHWPQFTARRPGYWKNPELLWEQLNPDRLLYNLYEELEQGQGLVK